MVIGLSGVKVMPDTFPAQGRPAKKIEDNELDIGLHHSLSLQPAPWCTWTHEAPDQATKSCSYLLFRGFGHSGSEHTILTFCQGHSLTLDFVSGEGVGLLSQC